MEDSRFNKLFTDPKYKNVPKSVRKIEVSDKRFSHMFTDKRFSNTAKIDEYGKKKNKKDYNEELEEFYIKGNVQIEGKNQVINKENKANTVNKEKKNNKSDKKLNKEEKTRNSNTNTNNNNKIKDKNIDKMKVFEEYDETDSELESSQEAQKIDIEGEENSKNEENNNMDVEDEENEDEEDLIKEIEDSYDAEEYKEDDDDSDTSEQFDDFLNDYLEKEQQEEDAWEKYKDKEIPTGDATKRISVVNLNWDNINSQDLFTLFNSLAPKPNQILKVSVYPSDFGIAEMAKEAELGPDKEIFATTASIYQKRNEESRVVHTLDEVARLEKEKEFKGYNESKLREYELKKLRYYYAVVEFKSLKVANYIYETYDGMEIERTQMFLDMRFVPEELVFPHKPKEVCDSLPSDYENNIKANRALNHSKVKLTWDETDDKRTNLLSRAFQKNFNEDEIQELLVSSDSEDEEDARKFREAFFKEDEENKKKGKDEIKFLSNKNRKEHRGKDKPLELKEGKDIDIEITFDKGFEGLDKDILKETIPDIKDKSLFEQHKQRRKIIGKEKKMEERIKRDDKKERRKYQDTMFTDQDKEDFNRENKAYKSANAVKDSANMDLLLQEDDYTNKYSKFNRNDKNEKSDDRFKALKTNKDFWVDPTHKNFNKKNR